MMRSVSTVRLIERAVADDRSYYATGECKQAVAGLGRVRQVVHDGREGLFNGKTIRPYKSCRKCQVVVHGRGRPKQVLLYNNFDNVNYSISVCNQPARSTQPSTLCGTVK